ncbi:MAG: ABC transporter permease [Parachlamydiaceae bacterium]|nr:ABC transporter permease [Parachlamydiaceae bacterium]
MPTETAHDFYWQRLWKQFKQHRIGWVSLYVIFGFFLAATYAPFLASSKPIFVFYDDEAYFPLFRYLFYSEFFTKRLDLFFNLLIFTFPLGCICWKLFKNKPKVLKVALISLCLLQLLLFAYVINRKTIDPASNAVLTEERQKAIKLHPLPDWNLDLSYMSPYAKLNMILRYDQQKKQHEILSTYIPKHPTDLVPATLWGIERDRDKKEILRQKNILEKNKSSNHNNTLTSEYANAKIQYIENRHAWLEKESQQLKFLVMPLIRPYHWEDDAGGEQSLNRSLPWWELTRINHKDLVAALLFGTRISLVVGILSVAIAIIIAIPIGALAGFYGGTIDIIVSRLLEVWESMPTFFMLLMIVAITGSKSIFLVIGIIGFFGWTGFSRYIRGEFFKQRNLPYVEACKALGYSEKYTMFIHILPNAIPPLLTLLPFAVMGAITSEAGLSFLGLGEEGSCSWGVLMDEGRTAFPGESYLLWPPAILLTLLLIAIALVGDALRDAMDPRKT